MLIDTVGQQTALIKANIARRRTDQTRNRVLFHVFGHVKAQQLDTKRSAKLLGDLGFTDTGWTGEQVVTDGLFRFAQTRTASLIADDSASMASS